MLSIFEDGYFLGPPQEAGGEDKPLNDEVVNCLWGNPVRNADGSWSCVGDPDIDSPLDSLSRGGSQRQSVGECQVGYTLVTDGDGAYCVSNPYIGVDFVRQPPRDANGLPIGDGLPGDPNGGTSRENWGNWYRLRGKSEQPQTTLPPTKLPPQSAPATTVSQQSAIFGLNPLVVLGLVAGGFFLVSQMSGGSEVKIVGGK